MAARAALLAVAPGPLATLQDQGRRGWQRFGVSSGGAMDLEALRAANALLGNPPGTAVVEFAWSGGEWEVRATSCRLVVTGGDFALSVDDLPRPAYTTMTLVPGQRLRIGAAPDGVWGYLGVAQGFAITPQLGSCSTHLRAGLGGLGGRVLQPGDVLPLVTDRAPEGPERTLARKAVAPDAAVRVVLGPQDDWFEPGALQTFLSAPYQVTREGDRMGYRLAGPALTHGRGYNIISDGVVAGSIQVPGTGQPIVLLMDRQPTGGYPKIATVVSADLGVVAQRRPGQMLRFRQIGLGQARRLRLEYLDGLEAMTRHVRSIDAEEPTRPFWLRG